MDEVDLVVIIVQIEIILLVNTMGNVVLNLPLRELSSHEISLLYLPITISLTVISKMGTVIQGYDLERFKILTH